MSGGAQLFKNKLGLNFNATLDPYALNNNNRRIDKLNINNGGSLFRLTSASIAMNYSLSNKSFSGGDDEDDARADETGQQQIERHIDDAVRVFALALGQFIPSQLQQYVGDRPSGCFWRIFLNRL